jgi:hypothetical protein
VTRPQAADAPAALPSRLRAFYPDAPPVLLDAIAARLFLLAALRLEHAARAACDEAVRAGVHPGGAPVAAAVAAELARVHMKGCSMLREDATRLYARRLELLAVARRRAEDAGRTFYVAPWGRGDAFEAQAPMSRLPENPSRWLEDARRWLLTWSRSYRVARETSRETVGESGS